MNELTQTEELAALEEVAAALHQDGFPGLEEQIAALHIAQREWLEANPDARQPSPYFDLLCDLEDLRDLYSEHQDVLTELAARVGESHYRLAHGLVQE